MWGAAHRVRRETGIVQNARSVIQGGRLRIFLAGTSFLPSYGGPAVSLSRLALELSEAGVEVGLWAPDGTALTTPLLPSRSQIERFAGTATSALANFGPPHLLHDNGIWLSHNHELARLAKRWGMPRVVSTRGMLEPWATKHKAWKKRVAWRLYQEHDLMAAQHLHATAVMEAENLSLLRLSVPISVVPNGVDLPERNSFGARGEDESGSGSGPNVALFLGRIYPVKGLPMLIEAWGQVRPRGWRLHIAGPDESNHRREVERAVRANNLADVVSFLGPVNAPDRERVYSHADLFVLPTHSESFGMAIAEALAHGLPVVTTTGAPWPMLVARGCGWRVEPTVERIAEALCEAMACDRSTLRTMGAKGRAYVAAEFSWPAVAQSMITLYRTAIASAAPTSAAWHERALANRE